MCSIDLEPCTVWRETPRKARKAHTCDGCSAGINPGDTYLEHFNVFDGNATTEKMCAFCWMVREDFVEAHGQSFQPSNLWQHLQDCVGENDDPDDDWRGLLAALKRRYRVTPSGREQLRRRWRRIGNPWPNTAHLTKPPEEWELSR